MAGEEHLPGHPTHLLYPLAGREHGKSVIVSTGLGPAHGLLAAVCCCS